VPPASLSALRPSKSSGGGPRIVPQTDRRQNEGRRGDWRGGRRVSDFSQFTGLTWACSPKAISERPQTAAEGSLH